MNYPQTARSQLTGFCIDLIENLQSMLKFEYSLHLSKDGYYGALDLDSGQWNGMMKELLEHVSTSEIILTVWIFCSFLGSIYNCRVQSFTLES